MINYHLAHLRCPGRKNTNPSFFLTFSIGLDSLITGAVVVFLFWMFAKLPSKIAL